MKERNSRNKEPSDHQELRVADLDVGAAAIIQLPESLRASQCFGGVVVPGPALEIEVDAYTLEAFSAAKSVSSTTNALVTGDTRLPVVALVAGDVGIVCVGEPGDAGLMSLFDAALGCSVLPVVLFKGSQAHLRGVPAAGNMAVVQREAVRGRLLSLDRYMRVVRGALQSAPLVFESLDMSRRPSRVSVRVIASDDRVAQVSDVMLSLPVSPETRTVH